MPARLLYAAFQLIYCRVKLIFLIHSAINRHCVRCRRIVCAERAVKFMRAENFLTERLFDFIRQRRCVPRLFLHADYRKALCSCIGNGLAHYCIRNTEWRMHVYGKPVFKPVGKQPRPVALRPHIFKVFQHMRCAEFYRLVAARINIYPPRQLEQNIIPRRAGTPVVSPGICWNYAWQRTVSPLRFADILQPYKERICAIEIE